MYCESTYKLSVVGGAKQPEEYIDEIIEVANEIEPIDFNPFDDWCCWINDIDALLEISKRYPDVVFILYGESEDHGDWLTYYKNGKKQHSQKTMKFEMFDENKLF